MNDPAIQPPLHPDVQAIVDAASAAGDGPADRADARREYAAVAERLGGVPATVGAVVDVCVGGVPVRVYAPLTLGDPAGVVVYAHGGGWQFGDLEGFDRVARALCAGAGHHVVSVDYRLAPEHPFPAARDDVLDVLDWAGNEGAAAFGWDGARVAVAGDSSGAQVVVTAARARPLAVRAQVLAYPVLDATLGGSSYTRFADGPMVTRAAMAGYWAVYRAGADPRDPALSPVHGAVDPRTPPTLVVVASHDPLRDDGLAYAQRLTTVGVPVVVRDCAGMAHGFLRWTGTVDEARRTLAAMGAFAAEALTAG